MSPIRLVPAAALAAASLAPSLAAQVFVDGTANLPAGPINLRDTEQVDFADVDLDGDWDAALANGGDTGSQQNQLWVNQGGVQGGSLGVFLDATATQFPVLADASRDVEFADIDADGDEDLAVANHASFSNQSNRIWVNSGFAQQGPLGFFVDETTARYSGLGGSGSSVAPGLVLAGGGFLDWSSDVDFGDLDSDGDLDLVHSSYGNAYNGTVPTRLFLNDGEGFFTEFNPSGHALTGSGIANGDPALWAEGLQQANTPNTTGAFADIAVDAVDVEAADLDGDLDIDLLLGARTTGSPRFFRNRLVETGSLAFRDVTGLTLPAGAISGGNKYEQELADLDGDGDLDLYGLNWHGFGDRVYENQGDGTFDVGVSLAGSNSDEEEVDFGDFDHDGDLDVYVANFSGADLLYQDVGFGPAFGLVQVDPLISGLAFTTSTARDAEVADVDGDGDDDVLTANGSGSKQNKLALNTIGVPDTTAPSFGAVAGGPGGAAAAGSVATRAQVYDNAPYYTTRYATVALDVSVEGVQLPAAPMRWAGGQVFHGELPANLVGTIETSVRAIDRAGNLGVSTPVATVGSGWSATEFGAGCAGGLGVPSLQALSAPIGGTTLYVAGGNVPPGVPGALVLSAGQQLVPVDLGDGICSNVQSPFKWSIKLADADGHHLLSLPVPNGVSGATVYAQYVALAGTGGNTWASSAGLEIVAP